MLLAAAEDAEDATGVAIGSLSAHGMDSPIEATYVSKQCVILKYLVLSLASHYYMCPFTEPSTIKAQASL